MKIVSLDKIIFLDVDGVLNIMSSSYYSHSYLNIGDDPIWLHLMKRLEFILERIPSAKIVISSSWGYKQLINKLNMVRFRYIHRIIDRTPRKHTYRGEQIKDWLDVNHILNYVVIEDEVSHVCGNKCNLIPTDRVIEVDMNQGLSHLNVVDVIIKLNDLKEFDGNEYDLTKSSYDFFYNKGYRVQVAIPMKNNVEDFDKFLSMWSKITLDNYNMYMTVSK